MNKHVQGFIKGLIRFVPLQFSTFGDLPLQFNYLESCHYNSRIHSPRPFCTPRAPLDPLAGDRICVLPSLPLADAHTGPTRAPTPRRTHSRLSFPSRLAAPNPRSPTAGGEDDGGRRRPGSAEATARIQEHARAGRGSWGRGTLGSSAPSRDGRRQREVRIPGARGDVQARRQSNAVGSIVGKQEQE